jgi:hypothetical protein
MLGSHIRKIPAQEEMKAYLKKLEACLGEMEANQENLKAKIENRSQ